MSNIGLIISGLNHVKDDIIELGQVDFNATVERVDADRNTITAFVINDDGLLYTFQIHTRLVGERFKIGDEISVTLMLREGNSYVHRELEDYQAESIPDCIGWNHDKESERLSFPYFLDEESMKEFDVEDQFKERLVKNSWAFGFVAHINTRD